MLECGDEIKVQWQGTKYDAEYLDPYLDSDIPNAIVVIVTDDAPGLRWDDNLVCVPDGDGWKGLFPT